MIAVPWNYHTMPPLRFAAEAGVCLLTAAALGVALWGAWAPAQHPSSHRQAQLYSGTPQRAAGDRTGPPLPPPPAAADNSGAQPPFSSFPDAGRLEGLLAFALLAPAAIIAEYTAGAALGACLRWVLTGWGGVTVACWALPCLALGCSILDFPCWVHPSPCFPCRQAVPPAPGGLQRPSAGLLNAALRAGRPDSEAAAAAPSRQQQRTAPGCRAAPGVHGGLSSSAGHANGAVASVGCGQAQWFGAPTQPNAAAAQQRW